MIIYPVVAGKFYPENSEILKKDVTAMFAAAASKSNLPLPKAIIAPHAGYIYSGVVAASAYAVLQQAKNQIKQVVIFAPAHQYPVNSIATTSADLYLTPIGKVKIDQTSIKQLDFSYIEIIEEAFSLEHAIEVHLPFLQLILDNFSLIPLLVGSASVTQVKKVMEKLWGDPRTLIIISSDLSHYHPYDLAKSLDKQTADAILALDSNNFPFDSACGATSIKALLNVAINKKLRASCVDLRNSYDTARISKDSVVGYGAFHFFQSNKNS